MRTPPTSHHGQPMGTRSRRPDEIHVGDTITWTADGQEWHGVITGREGQPYVEVWIVGDTRVYRRHVTQHRPGTWQPPVFPGHDAPDVDLDRLREALLEYSWDDAIARLGITPEDALRLWDQLLHEEARVG